MYVPDDEALLRAVLAAPDDDAPRLVYADWAEEHGDADRAAFIRAQVAVARVPMPDARWDDLIQIERTLWRQHRAKWTEWLPRWVQMPEFRRGFLEGMRCDAADFLARSDEVRLRAPIRRVRLDGGPELALPVFRSRALDGIHELTLSVHVPTGVWTHFTECPYLGRLEWLHLNAKGPPGELVAALTAAHKLTALHALRLSWCTLGDEQTARLVRHPWARRLRTLELPNNFITAEGGRAIAESPHLDGLETLDLRHNPVGNTLAAEALRRRFGGRVRL